MSIAEDEANATLIEFKRAEKTTDGSFSSRQNAQT